MEEFIREQERECFEEYKKLNIPNVSNCKHNVKNWDSERGTYLCSNCGKDFTNDL